MVWISPVIEFFATQIELGQCADSSPPFTVVACHHVIWTSMGGSATKMGQGQSRDRTATSTTHLPQVKGSSPRRRVVNVRTRRCCALRGASSCCLGRGPVRVRFTVRARPALGLELGLPGVSQGHTVKKEGLETYSANRVLGPFLIAILKLATAGNNPAAHTQ